MQTFQQKLFSKINDLTPKEEEIFGRVYKVWSIKGFSIVPKELRKWITSKFGSIEAVENQKFVKITNIITFEGAIFNELRTQRPIVEDTKLADVMDIIGSTQDANFAKPLLGTPSDTFGRIKGKHCITAANLTKYDGMHSLIIFNDTNPLLFSRKRISDYFEVSQKWFNLAHKANKRAIYPLFTWNCLWRAGASIVNGHAQVVLTEGQAYSKIEELRRLSMYYQESNKANYFDDVYMIHERLGLAFEKNGVRVLAKLTPIKEKEVAIFGTKFDKNLANVVSDVLNNMKETLGVKSFNLSVILPPMEKTQESWRHIPILVRIVDRGLLSSRTTDIGAMELYAQSVVGSDPYVIVDNLKKALLEKKRR